MLTLSRSDERMLHAPANADNNLAPVKNTTATQACQIAVHKGAAQWHKEGHLRGGIEDIRQ